MRIEDVEERVYKAVVDARIRCRGEWWRDAALEAVRRLTRAGFFRQAGSGGAARLVEIFAAEADVGPSEALALLAGAARQHFVDQVSSLADRVRSGLEGASRLALRDRGPRPAREGFPDRRAVAVARAAAEVMRYHTLAMAHTDAAFQSVEEVLAAAERQRADLQRRASRALGPEGDACS